MSHNVAAGSVINSRLQVDITDAVMCACWTGPDGQMQKKVKFALSNNSDDLWIDLYGGQQGSVYLYVGYPGEFEPVVTMPHEGLGGAEVVTVAPGGSPAGKTVKIVSQTQEIVPDQIDDSVAAELGLDDGWKAWAIPANPNTLAYRLYDGSLTFSTWVPTQWIGPGESFYGDGNGIGAWVFYIPLPEEISDLPDRPMVSSADISSEYLDQYYRVLGVGVRDRDGTTVGFAPTPPESSFSSATDF